MTILQIIAIIGVEIWLIATAYTMGKKEVNENKEKAIIEHTIKGLQAKTYEEKQKQLNYILEYYPQTWLIRKYKQWE